mmetsp:Transcript_16933/g.45571  ORF Transcript_16933/g.45571 Transcript_16933/m.45571 type:complete len:322 (-) Transcript_16933:109-1074(-)
MLLGSSRLKPSDDAARVGRDNHICCRQGRHAAVVQSHVVAVLIRVVGEHRPRRAVEIGCGGDLCDLHGGDEVHVLVPHAQLLPICELDQVPLFVWIIGEHFPGFSVLVGRGAQTGEAHLRLWRHLVEAGLTPWPARSSTPAHTRSHPWHATHPSKCHLRSKAGHAAHTAGHATHAPWHTAHARGHAAHAPWHTTHGCEHHARATSRAASVHAPKVDTTHATAHPATTHPHEYLKGILATEECFEDLLGLGVVKCPCSTAHAAGVEPILAEAIVGSALVLVREAVVRLGDTLEVLLGLWVSLVLVRVPADGRLLVCLGDVLL